MQTSVIAGVLGAIERFFMSWRFPAFILITLFLFWVLIMGMAFMPVSDSAWGAFAEDFKIWCFGYDPDTGTMEIMYLIMFTINPVMLSLVVWFVWLDPLKELSANLKMAGPCAAVSFLIVASIAASFVIMGQQNAEPEIEFKPETLRISQKVPTFTLINQNREEASLVNHHGKVVILTSVYTSCADACPMMLEQVRRVFENLTELEQKDVVLVAITMDPDRDTPDRMRRMADYYNLNRYQYEMLTGEPDVVNRVLDEIGIRRKADEVTGLISHVNLFLLVDGTGNIAFRFSLGDNQEEWMTEAVRVLIKETQFKEASGNYE